MENLTEKMFVKTLLVKADSTKHLDIITRNFYKSLRHFVVFSSFVSGRGMFAHSNYGMANSVMERIIEKRVADGFCGKAIQWGAISDVGLLADFQEKNQSQEFRGIGFQPIRSMLDVMDDLITTKDAIVSCFVNGIKMNRFDKQETVIDAILKVLQIEDKNSISMDMTLLQLGVDSLSGIEIYNILERDYSFTLTEQEGRTLTLSQIESRVKQKDRSAITDAPVSQSDLITKYFYDSLVDENANSELIMKLETKQIKKGVKILIIPGFNGIVNDIWRQIAKTFSYPSHILQFGFYNFKSLNEYTEAVEKVGLDFLTLNGLKANVEFEKS